MPVSCPVLCPVLCRDLCQEIDHYRIAGFWVTLEIGRAGQGSGGPSRSSGKGKGMARYYYKRSLWGRLLAFFVAVPVVALLAHLTYRWLLPFVPLALSGALLIVLCWVGFRRR